MAYYMLRDKKVEILPHEAEQGHVRLYSEGKSIRGGKEQGTIEMKVATHLVANKCFDAEGIQSGV